jgi:DNA-binding NtrC family response regulator
MAAILVIDDDTQIQTFVQRVLEMAGHEVQTASTGSAGLRANRVCPAELILCDLFMPEKEGLETIDELRREYPLVKIIAISGGLSTASNIDLLPVAMQLGANECLRKPFSPSDLTALVERALLG